MKFERSFINWDEGVGVCCWNAPSQEELEGLFNKVGAPFEKMVPVEEHLADNLT
jgi:hypothetical protein